MIVAWAFLATMLGLLYFGAGAVYLHCRGKFKYTKTTYLWATTLGASIAVLAIDRSETLVELQFDLMRSLLDKIGLSDVAASFRMLFPLLVLSEFFLLGILAASVAVWLVLKLRKSRMHEKGC
jgi:hypothetical protein